MNLIQVAKIARREYLARVRSRAFVLMTALIPIISVSYFMLVPALARAGGKPVRVSVLDAGTGLAGLVAASLRDADPTRIVVADVVTARPDDRRPKETLNAAVLSQSIDGYIQIEPDPASQVRMRYIARVTSNPPLMLALRAAVQRAALITLFRGGPADLKAVRDAQTVTLGAVTLTAQGERQGGFELAILSTVALTTLLFTAVVLSGQALATSIVEEKSSRLVEVMLGSVTPSEFLAGKIAGVLGSGLTQLAAWTIVPLVVLLQSAMSGVPAAFDISSVLSLQLIISFLIFGALGYLLYSLLFAIVAVTCTSLQDLHQVMVLAMLPMFAGLVATVWVISNPNTTTAAVLSLIPILTPIVMLARVNVLIPPLWQIGLGIALLVLTSMAISWAAAKIFQYSLLMTGKRPTLPDLMRVVRAG